MEMSGKMREAMLMRKWTSHSLGGYEQKAIKLHYIQTSLLQARISPDKRGPNVQDLCECIRIGCSELGITAMMYMSLYLMTVRDLICT